MGPCFRRDDGVLHSDFADTSNAALRLANTALRSRSAERSKFHINLSPMKTEGAGKTGCTLHPRSHVQDAQDKTHASIQVQRRQSDLPCAMVLTVSFELSPVTGLFVTVAPEKFASRELDASVGASRPHDFAIRTGAVRLARASASTASRALRP